MLGRTLFTAWLLGENAGRALSSDFDISILRIQHPGYLREGHAGRGQLLPGEV